MTRTKKFNYSFAFYLVVALLICVLVTMLSVKDIQHSSYMERAKSLNVVMAKIGDHLNIAFESRWTRARSFTKRIERVSASSPDDLIRTLENIYMETGEDFKAVDDNGIAYYHDGMQEYWKHHRSVSSKTETFILSPLQFGITNENYMKYILPLTNPIPMGDTYIEYTVLTEPLSALRKDFDTTNFGQGCLSFIIDKRGTFIYENGSNDCMADCYNFLAYVEKTVTFLYGESFERFKTNILDGINDTMLVEYNGSRYYLSFFDLDIENWASIIFVPEQNTQAESRDFTDKLFRNISIIFATAFALFVIGFLHMWKNTVTKQRMAAEAEKRSNEAKTNFISSMSHDIRTPMNAIVGFTELALHNKKDLPMPVRDSLEKIRLSATHMLMLINDILDISKIESGAMSLNIEEYSVVESTNTLANLIRPLAKDKNIDLRIHTYNLWNEYVLGDELRISQLCINLAVNAIKYTPAGGSVVIDFRQEQLDDMPNKVKMTFVVRDNGIGMSEEYQKIMYDVFTRGTDSRVNKVAGSGLGLPICKKMVQMMNGTLECQSAPGKGTTFTASVILEKGKPDEVYELPKARILVLDRDTISTNALRRVINRLGVDADIVNSPAELAVVLKEKHTYQVAFVELGAPQNKGIIAATKLRDQLKTDIPIVLTDIADMAEYSEQIAAAGIKQTMSKPYYYRVVYQTLLKVFNAGNADVAENNDLKYPSITGMNVLVAEDNDLNWEILYELLKMNNVKAVRAENGSECVEMLNAATAEQYDAVLMDVRMPVMDGMQATRIIRASDKVWIKTIPIVAMTADAFAEDIQHCLEAGMNGHLAKPINLDKLLYTLADIRSAASHRSEA